MEGVVAVAVLTQEELFAPLGHHAQRRLNHAVYPLQRYRVAIQVQPWERLGSPIGADGSPDPLHQFLTVDVHPLGLAFGLRVDQHLIGTSFLVSPLPLGSVAESAKFFRGLFYYLVRSRVYHFYQRLCVK